MKRNKALIFLLVFIAVFLLALYWDNLVETCVNLFTPSVKTAATSSRENPKNMPDLEPLETESSTVGQQTLTGKVCVALLFVDDENTSWTQEEAVAFTEKHIQPGVDFLHRQAALYGVNLELSTLIYTSNENRAIYYDGVIERGFTPREEDGRTLIYPDDTKRNRDILDRVAKNWGLDSVEAMYQALLDGSGAEQLRFAVIVNKGGWSCAIKARQACYIYAKDHWDREPAPGTFPHELLHLFGAEDLYLSTEMDGTVTRKNRDEMTMQMHPNAIMYGGFTNVADAVVCGYTAYLIGWLDALPPEYNCEEWWT